MDAYSSLSDEELVTRSRTADTAIRSELLGTLYARHYERVSTWCWRLAGRQEEAVELAQEVFLRVHDRLDGFRGESRFTTWLYQVTRSVTLNRLQTLARRRGPSLDDDEVDEPADPTPPVSERLASSELAGRLREAIARDLAPDEAKVLYLHFVDGLTLPAITSLMGLTNKSGAKALLVAARRKLDRGFGRWLSGDGSSVGGKV